MNWRMIALLAFAVIYFVAPDPFPGPVDDALVAVMSALAAAVTAARDEHEGV